MFDKTLPQKSPEAQMASAGIDVTEQVQATLEQAKTVRVTRKYVIVALTSLLVAGIALAAVLVGIYLYTQSSERIVEYQMNVRNGSTAIIKQDVKQDIAENVEQYSVKNGDVQAWFVNDYKRNIQTVKRQSGDNSICWVTALNRSIVSSNVSLGGQFNGTYNVAGETTLKFQMDDTPISDTSFLGKHAQELCSGIETYWMSRMCLEDDVTTGAVTASNEPKVRAYNYQVYRSIRQTTSVTQRSKRALSSDDDPIVVGIRFSNGFTLIIVCFCDILTIYFE